MVVCGALIALIGLSRIYEGHHWASDVVAAYLFGNLWLALTVLGYRWGKPRFFVRPSKAQEVHPIGEPENHRSDDAARARGVT